MKLASAAQLQVKVDPIAEISAMINRKTGVILGEKQMSMVRSRLSKRMTELKIPDLEAYLEYLNENLESESTALVSLLTTHHTFFFREFTHFEFLENTGLRRVVEALRKEGRKHLRVWSVCCSNGQEVYSLSMHLDFHLRQIAPDLTYEILGTDIATESVKVAANGVYKFTEIKEVPAMYLGAHWAKGSGQISDFVKAKASIKAACKFQVVNLLDIPSTIPDAHYDIIFCRNVFIYFTPDSIKSACKALLKRMAPHGYLFIGISESLNGLDLPLAHAGPSIYSNPVKASAAHLTIASSPAKSSPSVAMPHAPEAVPAPIRVFCVDDSPTVLTLLKKVLSRESGFEIVGTAANGLEASQKAKTLQFDVMTLDIHMPEVSGDEYLRRYLGPNHPPVVIVSSVKREDKELGLKCIELGARDFVEKPSLADLQQRGDEIRMKLKSVVKAPATPSGIKKADNELAQQFASTQSLTTPEMKLRLIYCEARQSFKLASILKSLPNGDKSEPPTIVVCKNGTSGVMATGAVLLTDIKRQVVPGAKLYAEAQTFFSSWTASGNRPDTTILVLGDIDAIDRNRLTQWSKGHIIIEDLAGGYSTEHRTLQEKAQEQLPYTSFAYHSRRHFLSLKK